MAENSVSRKRFTTTINPKILQDFRVACVKQQLDMNEAMEMLMVAFSDGVIILKNKSEKE